MHATNATVNLGEGGARALTKRRRSLASRRPTCSRSTPPSRGRPAPGSSASRGRASYRSRSPGCLRRSSRSPGRCSVTTSISAPARSSASSWRSPRSRTRAPGLALGTMYDNSFVSSATGDALSRLGEELGLAAAAPRGERHRQAALARRALPDGTAELVIPRGARLLTPGGHHVATTERCDALAPTSVAAHRRASRPSFPAGAQPRPGVQRTRPATNTQSRLDRFNPASTTSSASSSTRSPRAENAFQVFVEHTDAADRRRAGLGPTRATASCCCARRARRGGRDAIEIAVSLVPGVRQVVRCATPGRARHPPVDLRQLQLRRARLRQRARPRQPVLPRRASSRPPQAAIWEGPDGLRVVGRVGDRGPASDQHLPARRAGRAGRRRDLQPISSCAGCRCRRGSARDRATRPRPAAALKQRAARARASATSTRSASASPSARPRSPGR